MFPFRTNSILHPPRTGKLLVCIVCLGLYITTNAGKNPVKAKTTAPNQARLKRQTSEGNMTLAPSVKEAEQKRN